MTSTKTIIEEIRKLSARDRRVVIKQLEQLKTESTTVARRRLPATRGKAKKRPYAALLELAGAAHSNEVDVSTDKYRHIAAAYADTHDAT
jgi:hypothetical protein